MDTIQVVKDLLLELVNHISGRNIPIAVVINTTKIDNIQNTDAPFDTQEFAGILSSDVPFFDISGDQLEDLDVLAKWIISHLPGSDLIENNGEAN
jgi:GTPase Era involved in 16S rRNA processing